MTATDSCRACATSTRTGARDAGPILLLGAGGSARAVVVALLENGATQIRIANRTAEKAEAIAKEFGPSVTTVAWADRNAAMAEVALLVNCTDQGMVGKAALDIDLARLAPAHWLPI